ncbi:MAG: ABC transporter ATP-binding protein [Clostridiaceae bacterium]|nr:ABC transporter ATP-binding protein [Clostridiaceae bacterium]
MIEAMQLTKTFGSITALNQLNCKIQSGSIFGLVGSNGAGKSTFLRLLAGVYKPDQGWLTLDRQPIYENPAVKQRIFFIADQSYFLHQAGVPEMVRFYQRFYPKFSVDIFERLKKMFPVDTTRSIHQMSKGMQRQVILMIGLACQPDYLLLDEAFDGLDPVVRQLLKRLLADSVAGKNQTVIIASHNLRELEDICDHVGLLHQGGIVFEQELDSLKLGIHKIQAVFREPTSSENLHGMNILKFQMKGSLAEIVIRGQRDEIMDRLQARNPIFLEALPLTLEEVFIQELEVAGYDVNTFIN